LEISCVSVSCVDLGSDSLGRVVSAISILLTQKEMEMLLHDRLKMTPCLQKLRLTSNENSVRMRHGSLAYWVSGGLGGLGLVAAAELVAHGPQQISLMARRARLAWQVAAGLLHDFIGTRACTSVYACDVSDALAFANLLAYSS
jgi:uncharacterized protein YgfB (UPF0149 family)